MSKCSTCGTVFADVEKNSYRKQIERMNKLEAVASAARKMVECDRAYAVIQALIDLDGGK